MKSEWEQDNFNNCVEKVTYTKKVLRSDFLPEGRYPIISQEAEFINGYWDKDGDLYKTDSPVVIFGDHTQVLKYIDFDFVLGADGVKILKPKPFLDPRYFYYYLRNIHIKNLGYARHFRLLKETKVRYPKSLTEQSHIVSILDDIFKDAEKAKEIAEKNLRNAKDLFESYLENVFNNPGEDWIQSELGDMVDITSSKRVYKSEYVKTGVPFYRTKEIVQLENLEKISTELFISNERFLEIKDGFGIPECGDIMLTAIGTIGNVYVVQPTDKFYFKDGNILWLKRSDKISPNLLKYILKSYVKTLKTLNIGTAYNALTIEKLKKHKITIPPKSLQESIISKLDSLKDNSKRLERLYEDKLSEIDLLKKTVLNKAFSGEL